VPDNEGSTPKAPIPERKSKTKAPSLIIRPHPPKQTPQFDKQLESQNQDGKFVI